MANDRIVSIGGNVTASAISVGDGATAAAGRSRAGSAPRPEASLAAIGDALARLEALDPRVEARLEEAREIATRPEPDKTAIAKLLGEALAYAKATDGFVQAYDHIGPHVVAITHWLSRVAWIVTRNSAFLRRQDQQDGVGQPTPSCLGSAAAHLPSLLP